MITELLAELQLMDDKARVDARCYELVTVSLIVRYGIKMRVYIPLPYSQNENFRSSMLPGFIMWLLGVPLVVIILLFVFRVI